MRGSAAPEGTPPRRLDYLVHGAIGRIDLPTLNSEEPYNARFFFRGGDIPGVFFLSGYPAILIIRRAGYNEITVLVLWQFPINTDFISSISGCRKEHGFFFF